MTDENLKRVPEAQIEGMFLQRMSTRAFAEETITDDEVMTLFEAAKWAPSSFNEQPWLFLYETNGPDRDLFDSILLGANRAWASKAPLLMYACANVFTDDGGAKRTALFDTGAAWMSIALQAHLMGLSAHAMAGIDLDLGYKKLEVPQDKYEIVCAIAVGRKDLSGLPDKLLKREETPSQRKSLKSIVRRGCFPK